MLLFYYRNINRNIIIINDVNNDILKLYTSDKCKIKNVPDD